MQKKTISLALTLLGASGFAWITACSSSNNSSGSSSHNNSSSTSSTAVNSSSNSTSASTSGGADGGGSDGGPATSAALLIDDESAATGTGINAGSALRALLPSDAKIGTWYEYGSDGSQGMSGIVGTLSPNPFAFTAQDAGMFGHAACLSSPGYTGFSAGEGLNFAVQNVDSDMPPIVDLDLSSFTGITFWAMSAQNTTVRVKFPDDQTDSSDPNAACHNDAAGGQCDDSFSADIPLSSTWTQYTVSFQNAADVTDPNAVGLIQHGFGATFASLDTKHVRQLQFEDEGSGLADGGAPAFGYCIGPISFTK